MRRARVCYELVEEVYSTFFRFAAKDVYARTDWEVSDSAYAVALDHTAEAVTFFIYHEVAHALILTLALPVTGREEDATDQLAILLLDWSAAETGRLAVSAGNVMLLK